MSSPFSPIPEAIAEIRAGRMVVVVDDEDRENEGDLTLAAEKVTAEAVNFMARFGRGLICLPMTGERLDELRITLMVQDDQNSAKFGTAFCVPIEAKQGTTTGISASDRARTVLAAVDPKTKPEDLARPGHMFPLRAVPGGVLQRSGQTEAAVDLARLAGLAPAGVICEIMSEDGTMARVPELTLFCREHDLRMITVKDLIQHRMKTERLIRKIAEANLPTGYGAFRIHAFESGVDGEHHVALVMGEWKPEDPVLVRVHSQCLTGDIFSSSRCDCGEQLHRALELIGAEANSVAPGKRPLSSMTPTILLRDGKLFLVTGSPGGPKIISTVLLSILNVVDYGMDVMGAVSAPRIHHQWQPDTLAVEPAVTQDVIEGLRERGHVVEASRDNWSSAQALRWDAASGWYTGGSDPRSDGLALGPPLD